MGYSFRFVARDLLYVLSHRMSHPTAFVTPAVEHWLEREVASLSHRNMDNKTPKNIYKKDGFDLMTHLTHSTGDILFAPTGEYTLHPLLH